MSYGGGTQQWIQRVTPLLIKEGYEIIIVDSTCGKASDFEFNHEISYITLPYLRYLAEQKKILSVIRNTDVVYYSVGLAYYDFLIPKIALSYKKPIIGGWHAPIYFDNFLHNLYVNTFKKRLLRRLTAHHVINKYDKNLLKSWEFKNIFLIPHGVDTNKFKPSKEKWYSEKFRILFLGRFTYEKGVDLFIEIIRKFLSFYKNDQNIEVLIAGQGPLKYLFGDILKDRRVKFFGFINNPENLYQKTHVFLLTSRQESFGLTNLEALASGNIVIATPTAGPITIQERLGEEPILASNSIEFLAKLKEIYYLFRNDRKKLINLCTKIRRKVSRYFSLDVHVNNFCKMLEKVMNNENCEI